jgi:DNA-binding NarL/FixJ family response regulator
MNTGKHNTKSSAEKAEQRRVIWDMYEQGILVTEIAKHLKCSASSVSANLRRQKEKRLRIADYNKLTMRDHFAIAALATIGAMTSDCMAEAAYQIADSMMEARKALGEKE